MTHVQTMKLVFLILAKENMRTLVVYIYVVYLSYKIKDTTASSKLVDTPNIRPESDTLIQRKPTRHQGIFERFLQNLLDTLISSFPDRKLPKYVSILYHILEDMDYGPTMRLSTSLKELAHMYREDIKQELINYRNELNKDLPHRRAFLEAMNEVFTLRENMYFNDYLYNLVDYGNKDKLYITEETKNLLHNVIVAGVKKLSRRDRRDLKTKMKKAVEEYRGESDYSSGSSSSIY